MDCLSRDQLLLLQQNLTYEVYEQFMGMFNKDEIIPTEESKRKEYIINIMKEHDYWGEIHGWGDTRVYMRIPKFIDNNGPYNMFSLFKGTSKNELLEFLESHKIQSTLCPNDCLSYN